MKLLRVPTKLHLADGLWTEREILGQLKKVLQEHKGTCPVYLELNEPGAFSMVLKADRGYAISPSRGMVSSVEELLGRGSVHLKGKFAAGSPRSRRSARAH